MDCQIFITTRLCGPNEAQVFYIWPMLIGWLIIFVPTCQQYTCIYYEVLYLWESLVIAEKSKIKTHFISDAFWIDCSCNQQSNHLSILVWYFSCFHSFSQDNMFTQSQMSWCWKVMIWFIFMSFNQQKSVTCLKVDRPKILAIRLYVNQDNFYFTSMLSLHPTLLVDRLITDLLATNIFLCFSIPEDIL